jgi:hypothetical protein
MWFKGFDGFLTGSLSMAYDEYLFVWINLVFRILLWDRVLLKQIFMEEIYVDVLTGFIYLEKQMSFSQHVCCKYSQ